MPKLDSRSFLSVMPATDDLLWIQDASDTTDGTTGTSKRITFDDLKLTAPTIFVAASSASDNSKALAGDAYTCDGASDEVQIQAANDALPAAGGCIQLSEGTFNLDDVVQLSDDVSLHGASVATNIVAQLGTYDLDLIQVGNNATVSNLKIDGNGNAARGVTIAAGSSFVHISDCYFEGAFLRASVRTYGDTSPCTHIFITDNYFLNSDVIGIDWQVHYLVIANNIMVGGAGFSLDKITSGQGADHFTITGNIVEIDGVTYGRVCSLLGAVSGVVCNNYFVQTKPDGGESGIWVNSNFGRVVVSGNYIIGPTGAGAGVECDGASHVVIQGNNIRNFAAGIDISANSHDLTIAGNHLVSNTNGIVNLGSNNLIAHNSGYVTENEGAAANVSDGGTIAHGCAATPTVALVSPSVASEMVSVTAIDATDVTVAIKQDDGTAGTQQTIYWRAWV